LDTHGYATPATSNAQWSRPTLCGYQNQACVPSSYQSGYLLLYPKWENPKPRFWHFEPWFPEVLEIFENTLLYITVGSFSSGGGGGGGRGRFLYPPLVRWERDAIRPSFLPFGRLQCFVETICTRNRGGPTPVTDWHRSSATSSASPSPTPQNPVTDSLTNRRSKHILEHHDNLLGSYLNYLKINNETSFPVSLCHHDPHLVFETSFLSTRGLQNRPHRLTGQNGLSQTNKRSNIYDYFIPFLLTPILFLIFASFLQLNSNNHTIMDEHQQLYLLCFPWPYLK
jgi:hypothetical protein